MFEMEVIKQRMERYFFPPNPIVNPFSEEKGISWLNSRMVEGSFGIRASLDRSITYENTNEISLDRITKIRNRWKNLIKEDLQKAILKKDKKILSQREKWKTVKKGGEEEQKNIEELIGITTAFFEDSKRQEQEKKGLMPDFRLHKNQLYYIMLMSLNKGKYDFGELFTNNRGIQLDTGEGKTICNAMVAAVKNIQGETVHIIEQNYVSARQHAQEMAPFLNNFLHVKVGVVLDTNDNPKKEESKKPDIKVLPNGQIVVEKKNIKKTIIRPDGQIFEISKADEEGQLSYIWEEGELRQFTNVDDRSRSWNQQIVYCDFNSLGTDKVKDKIIGSSKTTGPQNLSKVTALVQEADALMIDWASNPFIVEDDPNKGDKAWEYIANFIGADNKDQAAFLVYSVWDCLAKLRPAILSDKTHPKFLLGHQGQTFFSETTTFFTEQEIINSFSKYPDLQKILTNNPEIINSAMEVMFGYISGQGYIPSKKPILTDQYGLPLDKRQISDLHHIYLQLTNIWDKHNLFNQPPDSKALKQIYKETYQEIEVSENIVAKELPTIIFNQYEQLIFTSGSLIPSSNLFAELYGGEVLAVSRHKPIKRNIEASSKSLQTECLDGGIAEVDFVEKKASNKHLYEMIKKIKKEGRAALIIMPNINEAHNLSLFLALTDMFEENNKPYFPEKQITEIESEAIAFNKSRQIITITGREEYENRGSLERSIININPGDIIITTQIAHRDIDPRLTQQAIENGGLESVVLSSPNERGLWQALQRAVRFNIPGKRRLILTDDEIDKIAHLPLIVRPIQKQIILESKKKIDENYRARLEKFKSKWQESVKGDIKAQRFLFQEYLHYLRIGESQVENSLKFSTVRDRNMDKWQSMFQEKLTSSRWWNGQMETIVAQETGLTVNISQLKSTAPASLTPIEQKILVNFYRNKLIVSSREQRTMWSQFLKSLEIDFFQFTNDPQFSSYSSWVTIEGQWMNFIENKIKRLKFQKQELNFPNKIAELWPTEKNIS